MRGAIGALLLVSVSALGGEDVKVEAGPGRCVIDNGLVRAVLTQTENGVREDYWASGGGWSILLTSGHAGRPSAWLRADGEEREIVLTGLRLTEQSGQRGTVTLEGLRGGHRVTKTVTVERDLPVVHVRVLDTVTDVTEISALQSAYSFLPAEGRPAFVWTPQLRPDSEDVIADHTFRSPAVILQEGTACAALVPDIDILQPWRSVQTAADLRVDFPGPPMLSYGIANWRTRAHVYYTSSPKMTTQLENSRVVYGYTLHLRSDAVPRQGYREVVRYLWDRWGRQNLLNGESPQRDPFSVLTRKAWREYLPDIALDTLYNGIPVTLLRQGRLAWSNTLPAAADDDSWFTVWFNSLRTAYGIRLYAAEVHDPALEALSGRVLELALLTPRQNGIGPSIYSSGLPGGRWIADHGWGGIEGGRYYSVFNNAWTGVWLLAWSDVLPARREEILGVARAFGGFLVERQQPSGVIPSWYDPESLEPAAVFRDENAETAGAALFLAELFRRTRDSGFLAAAQKAAGYIERDILPHHKWFDFETFFSCSRKAPGFYDGYTGQHPQNTLSMHQMAEACKTLYEVTGEKRHLDLGQQVLDYLCLYQQVWSPPWLSCPLFGGFGVQNTDGEWSDARQAYFAVTLMDYARLTGKREYAERGVASLRAMFSLFESESSARTWENYAHGGSDRPGGVTGIHWGTGSAAASVHIVRREWGDVYVHPAGWGVGIDGCSVDSVSVGLSTISIRVRDIVDTPRRVVIRFGAFKERLYRVMVNGADAGEFTAERLREGIHADIS